MLYAVFHNNNFVVRPVLNITPSPDIEYYAPLPLYTKSALLQRKFTITNAVVQFFTKMSRLRYVVLKIFFMSEKFPPKILKLVLLVPILGEFCGVKIEISNTHYLLYRTFVTVRRKIATSCSATFLAHPRRRGYEPLLHSNCCVKTIE